MKFNELNEQSKETAREWFRNMTDGNWDDIDSESLTEDFKETLTSFGWHDVAISWSLSSCQGDGVSFTGIIDLKDAVVLVDAVLSNKQKRYLNLLTKTYGEVIYFLSRRISNRYTHAYTCALDFESGDVRDNHTRIMSLLEDTKELVDEWRIDQCKRFESQGYRKMDYNNSDERVDETIKERDYDFDEEGKRI